MGIRLRTKLGRLIKVLFHSKVHDAPDYIAAHEFKNHFHPREGVDYAWVAQYAREVHSKFEQAHEALDQKAETIIKFLGGGAGLLSLGAIANVAEVTWAVAVSLGIALLVAVAALCFAALARYPSPTFMPPSIAWAIQYAENYGEEAENKFLSQWHLSCEGLRLTVGKKADFVKWSTWLTILSVILVAITFGVAVVGQTRT